MVNLTLWEYFPFCGIDDGSTTEKYSFLEHGHFFRNDGRFKFCARWASEIRKEVLNERVWKNRVNFFKEENWEIDSCLASKKLASRKFDRKCLRTGYNFLIWPCFGVKDLILEKIKAWIGNFGHIVLMKHWLNFIIEMACWDENSSHKLFLSQWKCWPLYLIVT